MFNQRIRINGYEIFDEIRRLIVKLDVAISNFRIKFTLLHYNLSGRKGGTPEAEDLL